jgi:hypothetical protein
MLLSSRVGTTLPPIVTEAGKVVGDVAVKAVY